MNKKKIKKVVFCIIIAFILLFLFYNLFLLFTKNKLNVSIETNNNFYTNSEIMGLIRVRDKNYNKLVKSKVKIELYDEQSKKIKDVSQKIDINPDEDDNNGNIFNLEIPEYIDTGKYFLKVTAWSGLYSDIGTVPISIINDSKSNVIISLDKGIYKPGDEINFRALILSKNNNTPIEQLVSVYIYDGNNNKVYTNDVETSEYGIISGKFKLADEVNSGTYKLTISTDSKETSKEFTVNPYITPNFEVNLNTDKETYVVGETAKISISSKYFFGEPVKGAEVTGTINDKEISGLTNEAGIFETTYNCTEKGKININCNVKDQSNYMIEANKTISIGTDIFEVEFLPEFGNIIKGINNDIYVITTDLSGNPLKTYSTVKIGNIIKQVISDDKGVGMFTLTSDEINSLVTDSSIDSNAEATIESQDVNGTKVTKVESLKNFSNQYAAVKTDKIKYEEGEDISVEIKKSSTSSLKTTGETISNNKITIYACKENQLLKVISTDNAETTFNLDDVTGIVDIYAKYTGVDTFKISKATIFIKPSKQLKIDINTDKPEYAPGDPLNIDFKTSDSRRKLSRFSFISKHIR